mmetsp:Transcript_40678/g.59457  ORF Transcript_40678/g.59457 Transcript_40678/m.59457 type:complete len:213 (+) Transcript_40678:675-1313(+)
MRHKHKRVLNVSTHHTNTTYKKCIVHILITWPTKMNLIQNHVPSTLQTATLYHEVYIMTKTYLYHPFLQQSNHHLMLCIHHHHNKTILEKRHCHVFTVNPSRRNNSTVEKQHWYHRHHFHQKHGRRIIYYYVQLLGVAPKLQVYDSLAPIITCGKVLIKKRMHPLCLGGNLSRTFGTTLLPLIQTEVKRKYPPPCLLPHWRVNAVLNVPFCQ